ncbi:MAG: S-methyl-5-thioribose-1-phosphate isomerase [Chitinispirillaceae bacterium]|nr:S-methyl-5-thioribose-1-phosphate isomerase [Chitinispirillaceae bacterium]
MKRLKTIDWADDGVVIIDQTRLPGELLYRRIDDVEAMFHAIRELRVRGAPAIGIAAAFGCCLSIADFPEHGSAHDLLILLEKNGDFLADARPTAVNLVWAVNRMKKRARELARSSTIAAMKQGLHAEAVAILEEDRRMGRSIGEHGARLLSDVSSILTHCNAGGLATAEYGTALAPVYVAAEQGKVFTVYADETRPLLQGARITAFELQQAGIPVILMCDNMAATVMAQGKVQAAIVGADRIAANGDTANKIGTYGVALLAKAHRLPFYVAAPSSTFDLNCPTGKGIPIEEREAEEITCGFGKRTAPDNVAVFNPAFDVTPAELISAFVTERGVVRPPFTETIKKVVGGGRDGGGSLLIR